MAAATNPAHEVHTWHDDTPSGFLKLSAEIRNKIYRLTLVTRPVTILDLNPDQWQAAKAAGHATRTSYNTKDHSRSGFTNGFNTEKWKNAKVSYALWRATYFTPLTIGMLALNRQTRAEAVPIFYGNNVFSFCSKSALVPFLRDRSKLSLQSIRYLHLHFEINEHRPEGWARTFIKLPKSRTLNLQKLTVNISDPYRRYASIFNFDTELQRWAHGIAKYITKLDMFGVTFNASRFGEVTPNKQVREASEEQLWDFLAPKILRKVRDEPHDAKSLLERRIRCEEVEWNCDGTKTTYYGG